MIPSLLKSAVLGTDAQPPEFNAPLFAPFAEAFAELAKTPPKALLLAAGLAATLDETQAPLPDPDAGRLIELETFPPDAFLPDDVDKAFARIVESIGDARIVFGKESLFSRRTIVAILRAIEGARRKLPPIRSCDLVNIVAKLDMKDAEPRWRETLGNVVVRTTARMTASDAARSCRLARVFFDRGASSSFFDLQAIATLARTGETINIRQEALDLMRREAPQAALELVEEAWEKENPERRVKLLATLNFNASELDVPFLEKVVLTKGGSQLPKRAAFDLLAKLRTNDFARESVAVADAALTDLRNPVFPKTNEKTKRLGIDGGGAEDFALDKDAEAFRKALARTPLDHWEEKFSASPDEIVERALESVNFRAILLGFRSSYLLFGGSQTWRRALLLPRKCDLKEIHYLAFLNDVLTATDPRDEPFLRDMNDRLLDAMEESNEPFEFHALALLSAFFSPIPWSDRFATFYGEFVENEFARASQKEPTPFNPNDRASFKRHQVAACFVAPIFPMAPSALREKFARLFACYEQRETYYYADQRVTYDGIQSTQTVKASKAFYFNEQYRNDVEKFTRFLESRARDAVAE